MYLYYLNSELFSSIISPKHIIFAASSFRKYWEINVFQPTHDMPVAMAGTYWQEPLYKKQMSDTISWVCEGWTRIYSASGRPGTMQVKKFGSCKQSSHHGVYEPVAHVFD